MFNVTMYYSDFNLSGSLNHLNTAKYVKLLGKGAFGTVKLYKCKNDHSVDNKKCDKLFAVKYNVYKYKNDKNNKLSKDKLFKKLTLNEYTMGTLLNHEYIIKTLDIDLNKNAIVFEYCKGIDFFDYIKKNNPLIQTKIFYFKQMLEGLLYMHNLGIAHMDLKLENIMIDTFNNKIKIIDFGHSKVFHDYFHMNTFILNKNIYGSLAYIAPEQFLKIKYNPEKVDVWACGIILYIIIYNGFPWYKATISDKHYHNYINNSSQFFTEYNNNQFLIEYNNILKKLLNPNPTLRPQIKNII